MGGLRASLYLDESIEQLNLISSESRVYVAIDSCVSVNCATLLSEEGATNLSIAIKQTFAGRRFYPLGGNCELILQTENGFYHYSFGVFWGGLLCCIPLNACLNGGLSGMSITVIIRLGSCLFGQTLFLGRLLIGLTIFAW